MLCSVRYVRHAIRRRPSTFRRVVPQQCTALKAVRYYADHGYGAAAAADHGHGHHKAEVQEFPEDSPEYIKKYYGHLADPVNKPEDCWADTLLSNRGSLECLAEINATEFYLPKLTGEILVAKYKEQLGHFESVRKPALLAEGVSGRIVHYLHEIYKLRAYVPLWEVKKAVSEIGFLKSSPNYRVVHGDIEPFPTWKIIKGQSLNTSFFNPAFDPANSDRKRTNAEEAAANLKIFRGYRGFIKAAIKGLTDAQKDHLDKVLGKAFVSKAEEEKIRALVHEIKELSGSPPKVQALLGASLEAYRPGTPERLLFSELLSDDPSTTSLVVNSRSTATPTQIKEKFLKVIQNSKAKDPSRTTILDRLWAGLEFFSKPEVQKDLSILRRLQTGNLTPKQLSELVSIFEDNNDDDALLNDVVNPHPIAARLWGDRVALLNEDSIHYTKTYEEGADSTFRSVDAAPHLQKDFDTNPGLNSPTPMLPFNSALEEIIHLKLERLAREYYKFDLSSDFGLARFDLFTRTFDISPGEATLDRTHTYPPPWHTYDELPIIKFDGYDPLSVESPVATPSHVHLSHKAH